MSESKRSESKLGDDSYDEIIKATADRNEASIKGYFLREAARTGKSEFTVRLRDGADMLCRGYISSIELPVVVLIHQIGGCDKSWIDVQPLISPYMNVISVSLSGWGDTRGHKHATSIKQYCNDILQLIDHLGCDQITIVGYELGSTIGFEMMKRHPEKLFSLVLLDPADGFNHWRKNLIIESISKWDKEPERTILWDLLGMSVLRKNKLIGETKANDLLECAKTASCDMYKQAVDMVDSYKYFNDSFSSDDVSIPVLCVWPAVAEGEYDGKRRVSVNQVKSFIDCIQEKKQFTVKFVKTAHCGGNIPMTCAASIKDMLMEFMHVNGGLRGIGTDENEVEQMIRDAGIKEYV